MRELETIGLLIQAAQGDEISDATWARRCSRNSSQSRTSPRRSRAGLRAVCGQKLEKEQFKAMRADGEHGRCDADQNRLLRAPYAGECNDEMQQNKADKIAAYPQALQKTFKAEMDEGLAQQNAQVQEALGDHRVGAIEGAVELLERDVASAKHAPNDPLPALVEEQKQREKDIYQYIEGQWRFGLQQEDIARQGGRHFLLPPLPPPSPV